LAFKIASAQSGLTGATAIPLKSAALRFNQNVEADDSLGAVAPTDFLNKNFTIEGEVEAVFQNESEFKTHFNAGTARALRFDLTSTTLIGSSSVPKITIDLHSVVFTEMSRPIRINDIVIQRLSFKAHYSIADSKIATVTCINATTSY
jgi:hypothetical protein